MSESENENSVKHFYPMARSLLNGNVVDTVPVQRVLGGLFRHDILDAFEGDDDHVSFARLAMLAGVVKNRERIINEAWKDASKDPDIDYDKISPGLREYVPKKVVEDYAAGLKKSLAEMKRFDVDLFRRFLDERVSECFSASNYGRLRNQALEIYFSQSPRPKIDDIKSLNHFGLDPKEIPVTNKLKAFLTLDFLARSRWQEANGILHTYDVCGYYSGSRGLSGKPASQFLDGVKEYVNLHGKISVGKDGLSPRICYPSHNNIPDFIKRNNGLFEIQ